MYSSYLICSWKLPTSRSLSASSRMKRRILAVLRKPISINCFIRPATRKRKKKKTHFHVRPYCQHKFDFISTENSKEAFKITQESISGKNNSKVQLIHLWLDIRCSTSCKIKRQIILCAGFLSAFVLRVASF